MLKTLTLVLAAVLFAASLSTSSSWQSQAQQPKETANLDAFRFLLGEWVGEGAGAPGEATGGFSFSLDLGGKILIRRNRADYPATKDKPAFSHTDLMVIYQEPDGNSTRAIYFDNEGHVINYGVSLAQDQTTVTFLSDPSPSSPRFRFVYNKAKNDTMTFRFDIAPPGNSEVFKKYLEGVLHRK